RSPAYPAVFLWAEDGPCGTSPVLPARTAKFPLPGDGTRGGHEAFLPGSERGGRERKVEQEKAEIGPITQRVERGLGPEGGTAVTDLDRVAQEAHRAGGLNLPFGGRHPRAAMAGQAHKRSAAAGRLEPLLARPRRQPVVE